MNSLLHVGVCGILHSWFVSYLTNRKQRVILEGFSSDTVKVTSGVPQGSILGPLLFIVSVDTINHLPISSNSSLGMYADDIMYWREIRCNEDVVFAQSDLNMISDEIEVNDLRLNTKKTKLLVISRKQKPPAPTLSIKGEVVEQVPSFKYFGITISQNLSWSLHMGNTCCKARRMLGYLYRFFRLADRACLSQLYRSLVLPVLSYCSSVWDPLESTHINKLERVQGFAARLVTGRWSERLEPIRKKLG